MPGVSIRGGRLDTRTQEEDDVEAEDSRDPAEYRSLQGPLQAERTRSQHLQGEHGLGNA